MDYNSKDFKDGLVVGIACGGATASKTITSPVVPKKPTYEELMQEYGFPDLYAILENDETPNLNGLPCTGKVAILCGGYGSGFGVANGVKIGGTDNIQKAKTSDGMIYDWTGMVVTHSWDMTKDIEGNDGRIFRWIILYYTNNNITDSEKDIVTVSNGSVVYAIVDNDVKSSRMVFGAQHLKDMDLKREIIGTDFSNSFVNCYALTHLPDKISTITPTSLFNFCLYCYSLQEAPYFYTGGCGSFQSLYQSCRSIKKVANYDFTNASTLQAAFLGCVAITQLPDFNVTKKISSLTDFLVDCYMLEKFPKIGNGKDIDCSRMSRFCKNWLKIKEIPDLNFYSLTSINDNNFTNLPSLEKIGVISSNTNRVYGWFVKNTRLYQIDGLSFPNLSNFTYSMSYLYSLRDFPQLDLTKASGSGMLRDSMSYNYNLDNLPNIKLSQNAVYDNTFSSINKYMLSGSQIFEKLKTQS